MNREPGRCRAMVLRNGYYTGRRCSRKAVEGDLCKQHAKMRRQNAYVKTVKP